ncbi:MAG TPA: hypothetical protein VM580_24500 [Labilithrix sp.]|nr:hypothetical protein [Labilithrix sp.]
MALDREKLAIEIDGRRKKAVGSDVRGQQKVLDGVVDNEALTVENVTVGLCDISQDPQASEDLIADISTWLLFGSREVNE